jgi:hypothetical protein
MTVIDGRPYYESSGTNSQHTGVWFPFVMLKDTSSIVQVPAKFKPQAIKTIFGEQSPLRVGYFFKYEISALLHGYYEEAFRNILEGRIPDLNTLLISLRLTRVDCVSRHILLSYPLLTEADRIDVELNRIELEKQPELLTADPAVVNQWLINAGALDINELLTESLTQPLDVINDTGESVHKPSLFSSSHTAKEPILHALTTGDLAHVFKRI